MAVPAFDEVFLEEIYFDFDSDNDFEEFTQADIDGEIVGGDDDDDDDEDGDCVYSDTENDAPSGYYHPWLVDFEEITGPKEVPDDISEGHLFRLFLNDEIITLFVNETNIYAGQVKEKRGANASAHSYINTWKDTTFEEMKAFLAILLLIGLTKRSSFDLYWSTDTFIEMPGFRHIMARDRFLRILSFFHLSDNSKAKPRNHPEHDRAHKIRPLFEKLVPLWQKYFYPGKELSVDESMICFKEKTTKPTKWDLKAWGLADSKTEYIYNWLLYLGRETDQEPKAVGVAHKVVSSLSENVQNKGHVIYMGNCFSSPSLFQNLAQHGTGACGTLRVNRQDVPDEIKAAIPRAGELPITHRDGRILYISWYDKSLVNLLTTAHSAETFRKEVSVMKCHEDRTRIVYKPCAVQSYYQHMGGIDRAGKQMTYYMVLHRCTKWWKKVFFYLFEICFSNALVIWKAKSACRVNAEKFRLKIVHSLLEGYQSGVSHRRGRKSEAPPAERLVLTEHHLIINPKRLKSGRPSRPDCGVCSNREKKRHQTQFVCRKCDVALCPYPCFQRYHSLMDYKVDCTPELHRQYDQTT